MFHVASLHTSDVRLAYKYAWLLSYDLSQPIIIYDDNDIYDYINASVDSCPTLVEIPYESLKVDLTKNVRLTMSQEGLDTLINQIRGES